MTHAGTILHSTSGFVHPSIQIIQTGKVRYLRFGSQGGWQGALDLTRPLRPVFPYQRAFGAVVSGLLDVQSYLSIGVGSGTSLRTVKKYHPNIQLQAVELDETVLNLAIEYFDAPSHHEAQYWVGDGVQFLHRGSKGPYDLIFLDAYMSNRVYSPSLEPRFAPVLANSVGERGIVMCNLIAAIPFRGRVRAFLDSANRCFSEVWVLPVGVPLVEQNVLAVLFKAKSSVPEWKAIIQSTSELGMAEKLVWPWRVQRYKG